MNGGSIDGRRAGSVVESRRDGGCGGRRSSGVEGVGMVKVALVPSAVSDGAGARGLFLTSYLVNDRVAVDAGGLGLIGDLEEQGAVRDIFLTHSHLDHVASLPLWLDTHFGGPTVTI